MGMPFLSVALGVLAGVGQDISTSALLEKLRQQDVVSLISRCIADAVRDCADLLSRFARPADGVSAEAYVDKKKLSELLNSDDLIEPLTSQRSGDDPWSEYLGPFMEIIVIPGCPLSPGEHLDVLRKVIKHAGDLFGQRVASEHPAFEQVLLEYQQQHAKDHDEIKRKIEDLPRRTIQELVSRQAESPSPEPAQLDYPRGGWTNPFSVVAADDLDLNDPDHVRQIKQLFISRWIDLSTICKRFNTILEGQRGTGKTMIFKYLGFETQLLEWQSAHSTTNASYLDAPSSFVGVYSKLGQGVYDKSDFEAIDSTARRERVFEHRLVLQLIHDVLQTMSHVYDHASPDADCTRKTRQALKAFLRLDGVVDSSTGYQDLIEEVQNAIRITLIPQVDTYLGSVTPGAPSGPTAFDPWLTLSGSLLPILRVLRGRHKVPFYLMVDDFDVLEPYQQACVFKTASQREFALVCFKFGIMILGKKVSVAGTNRTFRVGDDYDYVDLDWTQGGLHAKYGEAVLAIAQARVEAVGWKCRVEALFPRWQRGEEIRREVAATMEKEWESAAEKPTKARADYTSKYGNARFFQMLRKAKIRIRYAGIEDVVMVSSGIFRQFLEVCKLVTDRAHDLGWTPDSGGVQPEIQDDAIRDYSDSMIQQLSHTSGDTQALLSGDIEVTSLHMLTLVESLCDLFYARLHTPGHGEPEIICVAIRDDLSACPQADAYLKVAVRESMLHRFQYPPKSAGGPNLPSFMLNRRLGPRRDLSIRRMQGRVEIDAGDILLGVQDRRSFFKKIAHIQSAESDQEEFSLRG
jgi:hypothetical protein